jgi:hypothetical protein
VMRALTCAPPSHSIKQGRWDNAGFVQGRRLATHVRSWIVQPQGGVRTSDAETKEVGLSLLPLVQLVEGIDHATWSLERPAINQMRLELDITLAPASDSSGQQQFDVRR